MTLTQILKHYSPEEIFTLLRSLAIDLNIQADPFTADPTPAAVLIPFIDHPEPTLLLTLRTSHLSHHAGQISFPGGRMDPTDIDLQSCVLRETHEEIGITAQDIQIVGDLGLWPSYSGYVVKPFIGIINPSVNFTPCSNEVAEIFEVPLDVVLEIAKYELIHKDSPIPHHYYQIEYEGRVIWGLTAGLLRLLAALVEHHQIK